jgi:hypothetical protein
MAGVVSAVDAIAIPMTSLRISNSPLCDFLEDREVFIFSPDTKQAINVAMVLQECRAGALATKMLS